ELFFCERGRFQTAGRAIHDTHPYGWLSFAEVIQYSSNIGAAKVGERLGRERYHRYLRAFGFGGRTGIELPGETPGIVRPVQRWTHVDLATLSFGQGVSVTPVQMAAAFAAIANGGTLLRPFVVKRVVAPDGEVVLENEPTAVRRVVSTRSARTTTELLRRVVEHEGGTGTKARLEDFPVAGKTGTAQKVDPSTGVYSSKRIGSFVGFVPADEPRAVILVLIDEPSTSSYGGVVAAPVFRAIAAGVLKRLGVEPPAPIVLARAPRGAPQKPGARRARTAARGAGVIVGEGEGAAKGGVPVVSVAAVRRVLAHAAARLAGEPSAGLTLVGVTGTNGKTSTTFILEAIWLAAGLRAGVIGTV